MLRKAAKVCKKQTFLLITTLVELRKKYLSSEYTDYTDCLLVKGIIYLKPTGILNFAHTNHDKAQC